MNDYIKLAHNAIKIYLESDKIINVPDGLPEEFYNSKAGVFVTIYDKTTDGGKALRGCIGTYMPQRKNVAEEIIHNAIAAATQDYRFNSLTKNESDNIALEVSILSEPEKVSDLKMLDAQKYGVIVSTETGKCGLLLPAIEDINNFEEQISIACQKGGIDPACDKLTLHRFTVKKYTEQQCKI